MDDRWAREMRDEARLADAECFALIGERGGVWAAVAELDRGTLLYLAVAQVEAIAATRRATFGGDRTAAYRYARLRRVAAFRLAADLTNPAPDHVPLAWHLSTWESTLDTEVTVSFVYRPPGTICVDCGGRKITGPPWLLLVVLARGRLPICDPCARVRGYAFFVELVLPARAAVAAGDHDRAVKEARRVLDVLTGRA